MKKILSCILLLVILSFGQSVRAEETVKFDDQLLFPTDQGIYIESFKKFRESLLEAIKNKDADAVLAVTSPDIRYTFGLNKKKTGFIKHWELKNGQDPERTEQFWDEFEKVLKYGGAFDDLNSFSAPYYFANWPEKFDAYCFGTVIGEGVNIYQKTDEGLKPAGTLTYNIIKRPDSHHGDNNNPLIHNEKAYIPVILSSGKKVYIYEYYVGYPIGYRAIFVRGKDGKWMMNVFIAGD